MRSTLELTAENWRPGAHDFVASTDLDVFAVVTKPLDLFTRGGRKAQARGESEEATAFRLRADQDVQLDTVRRYLEAWRGRELVAALEAQTENLGGIVSAMEKRIDAADRLPAGFVRDLALLRSLLEGGTADALPASTDARVRGRPSLDRRRRPPGSLRREA